MTLVDKFWAIGPQIDFIAQDLSHVFAVTLIGDWLRQRLGQKFRRILSLDLFAALHGELKVAELIVKKALPNRFQARVVFLRDTAIIVLHFVGFMQKPLFHPTFCGIYDRLIL